MSKRQIINYLVWNPNYEFIIYNSLSNISYSNSFIVYNKRHAFKLARKMGFGSEIILRQQTRAGKRVKDKMWKII